MSVGGASHTIEAASLRFFGATFDSLASRRTRKYLAESCCGIVNFPRKTKYNHFPEVQIIISSQGLAQGSFCGVLLFAQIGFVVVEYLCRNYRESSDTS